MPDARFFLELGGVLMALALLARLAGRGAFSPAPLYLLAGLMLGSGGLIPIVTADEFISAGAEIGIVLLLFMLGLEYHPRELVENLRGAAPAGGLDFAANFTPGFGAGLLLGFGFVEAVLLGGITFMSSTGVIAKAMGDLGWTGNRETPVVLSILVLEDLLMAVYLPLIALLLVGGHAGEVAGSIVLAVALVGAVLLIAVRAGERLSGMLFSHSDETLLLSILGLVFLGAGAAQRLDVSAAVGAFLVGIAVGGQAAERARVLLAPLRDLFAAVFFVFFGLQIDPATIPPVLGIAVALAIATAATKVATGWWAAARAGVGTRGRMRAGTLLIARGEFSIAIAGIGIAAGVEERFGALAAAYVLVLAVLGPAAARWGDPWMASVLRGRRAPTRVVLFTSENCGLCDRARLALGELGLGSEEGGVPQDHPYRLRTPVIEGADGVVAEGLIDKRALRKALRGPARAS